MIKENGRWSRGWINPETARGTLSLSGARVEKYKNSMWNTFTFWSKGWKIQKQHMDHFHFLEQGLTNTETARGTLSLSGARVYKYKNSMWVTFTFRSRSGKVQTKLVEHFHFLEPGWINPGTAVVHFHFLEPGWTLDSGHI